MKSTQEESETDLTTIQVTPAQLWLLERFAPIEMRDYTETLNLLLQCVVRCPDFGDDSRERAGIAIVLELATYTANASAEWASGVRA